MSFRFESLDIWKVARSFATTVFTATAGFPRKEEYGLTSQMNRAVNPIGLNIAEGSGKRSNKAFDYHLEIAIGSAYEVAAASCLALDRAYISPDQQSEISSGAERLCKSINAFRNTLRQD